MIYGRDYDQSPRCANGHECEAVDFCVRCDGIDFWCEKHLTECGMCKRTFCPLHDKELQKTDMGMLCEECRDEFCIVITDEDFDRAVYGDPLPMEAEPELERARR